uniref:Uncharacterized protein n=1 Tax=Anguilla anguilla TaxID=7936 RepID=A0A0E9TAS2_ANGAN
MHFLYVALDKSVCQNKCNVMPFMLIKSALGSGSALF